MALLRVEVSFGWDADMASMLDAVILDDSDWAVDALSSLSVVTKCSGSSVLLLNWSISSIGL